MDIAAKRIFVRSSGKCCELRGKYNLNWLRNAHDLSRLPKKGVGWGIRIAAGVVGSRGVAAAGAGAGADAGAPPSGGVTSTVSVGGPGIIARVVFAR